MERAVTRGMSRRLLIGAGAAGIAVAGTAGVVATGKGGAIIRPGVARARAIAGDSRLPPRVDVVVVGGGNVGVLTALTLAERGMKVALCEKGVIAGEASGRSLGYVDGQFLDPVKMPIIARSKALWAGLNARLGAETGFRRVGLLTLLPDDAGVDAARAWLASVKGAQGVDARLLTAAEARRLDGGFDGTVAGALLQPSDGIAEPQLAAPAAALRLRQLGGIVLQGCAVRGFETAAGRISGVVTEKGPIGCSAAVLAGGVWSPVMARSLGLDLPQFMAFGSVVRVSPVAGPTLSLIAAGRNVLTRRNIQGGYDLCTGTGMAPVTWDAIRNIGRLRPALSNLWNEIDPALNLSTFVSQAAIPHHWALDEPSPFEQNRIFMPQTGNDALDRLITQAPRSFAFLRKAKPLERWAGALTSTPDNMPVISAVDRYPGLFIGSGFYYGLTMGPAAGEALADLVTGTTPQFDLSLYRLERFSDGSPIRFRA